MADKKHILFISSWYPTPQDPTLGIFNVYFARAAAQYNRVSVLQVVPDNSLAVPFIIQPTRDHELNTIVVRYKSAITGIPLLAQYFKWSSGMKAFEHGYEKIAELYGKVDLLHLNVAMPKGLGVLHLHRKFAIPYVLNENWSGYTKEDNNYRGFLQKYFTSRIVNGARAILPTSNYLMIAMQSHGLRGKYHVIPNVVDVSLFKPMEVFRDKTETVFIHVSSLNDREKNVSGLIRGFALALKQQAIRLMIVGEGVDKEKYIDLVKELGIEKNVDFKGRLFTEDLVKAINGADAMVMFSYFETFCLVNIEAFACGKPVISSRVGAIPEYLSPERGLLVETGNEKQLADALMEFASGKTKYDPQQIRRYAVNNYSYEVIGKKLDGIYTNAIEKGKHV